MYKMMHECKCNISLHLTNLFVFHSLAKRKKKEQPGYVQN